MARKKPIRGATKFGEKNWGSKATHGLSDTGCVKRGVCRGKRWTAFWEGSWTKQERVVGCTLIRQKQREGW